MLEINQVHMGCCLDLLPLIPDDSIHCVVTSPPYWGLRDYGVDNQIGLEKSHDCGARSKYEYVGDYEVDDYDEDPATGGMIIVGKTLEPLYKLLERRKLCGECYTCRMVGILREVRRVLRPDGTFWLNMGDSYTSGNRKERNPGKSKIHTAYVGENYIDGLRPETPDGLKPKDLIGQPWALAFALRNDGWWLRSDIIWHKPNPMPESVADRPTKSHEHIFLLTKSVRYFYDADAIREKYKPQSFERNKYLKGKSTSPGRHRPDNQDNRYLEKHIQPLNPAGCNARTVWTINTKPFPEAHFATFPEELPRRCISAGTSAKGVCPECGAPWERMVEKGEPDDEWKKRCGADSKGSYQGTAQKDYKSAKAENASEVKARILAGMKKKKTIGWRIDCKCTDDYDADPATVLDPFAGAATTCVAANKLGRNFIGIELSPEYCEIARKRIERECRQEILPLCETR